MPVLLAALALATMPSARPRPVLASWCSPSGDVCLAVTRARGHVDLELATFARYFARYRLCVRRLPRAGRCGTYPVRYRSPVYGSSVTLQSLVGRARPGRYRATWSLGGRPLGRTLAFRVPRA